MRKHAIQSTLYIRTSTYIHGVHSTIVHGTAPLAPAKLHARVPSPEPACLATSSLSSTPTRLTRPSAPSTSGATGSPASPTATLVVAVHDEHMFCAREHASRERRGHQQPRPPASPVGLSRGSGPDRRHRPRGCRQRPSETAASDMAAGELGHGAFAPRPRPSAVRAGSNHEPAQTAVSASLRPPQARAWFVPCSNARSDSGR